MAEGYQFALVSAPYIIAVEHKNDRLIFAGKYDIQGMSERYYKAHMQYLMPPMSTVSTVKNAEAMAKHLVKHFLDKYFSMFEEQLRLFEQRMRRAHILKEGALKLCEDGGFNKVFDTSIDEDGGNIIVDENCHLQVSVLDDPKVFNFTIRSLPAETAVKVLRVLKDDGYA